MRVAIILFIISLILSLHANKQLRQNQKSLSESNNSISRKLSTCTVKMEQQKKELRKIIPTVTIYKGRSWEGKVSHYSRSGCLGCSPNMTMANGQPLDDNRATIAFNFLPMNTKVLVKNLDNGKSIEALVTDTGGFNNLGPHGRIADLTPAVANYLGTITDVTNIKIEQL